MYVIEIKGYITELISTALCSDEIYALSVFAPDASEPFRSALTIAQEFVADNEFTQKDVNTWVHAVYGLSKDWCASGLRVGLLYSRNKLLQQALNSLAPFSSISNHTQHVLTEVLSDEAWTAEFSVKNAELLAASYDVLSKALVDAGIPFTPARAGMFVWIDLRKWLQEASWDGERRLWTKLCDDAKLILTPGESCHANEPGFFRLCFAWMPKEALGEAVDRLKASL